MAMLWRSVKFKGIWGANKNSRAVAFKALPVGNLHAPLIAKFHVGDAFIHWISNFLLFCLRNKLKILWGCLHEDVKGAAPELGSSSFTWHKQDISKMHFILWWLNLSRRGNDGRGDRDTEPETSER